jgi:hypothetical protein
MLLRSFKKTLSLSDMHGRVCCETNAVVVVGGCDWRLLLFPSDEEDTKSKRAAPILVVVTTLTPSRNPRLLLGRFRHSLMGGDNRLTARLDG